MTDQTKVRYAELNSDETAVLADAVEATYSAVVDTDLDSGLANHEAEEDAVWLKEQRLTHRSLHWLRRPSIVMISICVFLCAFASASAESSRQFIGVKLACNSVAARSGDDVCDPVQTQIVYLNLQQAYIIAIGCATILSLGKLGPLSDQYGRRVFLGLMVLVQSLGKVVKMGVMMSSSELRFAPMVAAEFFSNLCGGVMTLLMLSNCYVSDIAEVHQRTFYLGIVMALFFLGLSLGPSLGNYLLSVGARAPVSAAGPAGGAIAAAEYLPLKVEIGVFLAVLLFVVAVLPESRTENARRMSRSLSQSLLRAQVVVQPPRRFSWGSLNFLRLLRVLTYPDDVAPPLRRASLRADRILVWVLVACDCALTSLIIGLGEVYVLYGIFRFSFNAHDVGEMLTVIFSLRAVTLLVVSPLLNHKLFMGVFGLRAQKLRLDRLDWAMIMTGYVAELVGMFVLGLSLSARLYLFVLAFTSLGAMAMPAMVSGLVKFFPELKLGEVFGAMTVVKNSLQIVVPFLFLNMYKQLVVRGHARYVFFFVCGAYAVCIVAVTWVLVLLNRADAREEAPEAAVRRTLHHRNLSFSVGV